MTLKVLRWKFVNKHQILNYGLIFSQFYPRTSKGGGGGGSNGPPIGFSDLKFEAFKQSKWNFQYL